MIIEFDALIVFDDKEIPSSFFILLGAKHCIIDLSEQPAVFIEVQTGTYFGEDDIVSLEDKFDSK